jgi:hypothetical protein
MGEIMEVDFSHCQQVDFLSDLGFNNHHGLRDIQNMGRKINSKPTTCQQHLGKEL